MPKVSNILFEQLQPGQCEREELDEEESGCLNQNQGQNLNRHEKIVNMISLHPDIYIPDYILLGKYQTGEDREIMAAMG